VHSGNERGRGFLKSGEGASKEGSQYRNIVQEVGRVLCREIFSDGDGGSIVSLQTAVVWVT
jgi:hypothetical protein